MSAAVRKRIPCPSPTPLEPARVVQHLFRITQARALEEGDDIVIRERRPQRLLVTTTHHGNLAATCLARLTYNDQRCHTPTITRFLLPRTCAPASAPLFLHRKESPHESRRAQTRSLHQRANRRRTIGQAGPDSVRPRLWTLPERHEAMAKWLMIILAGRRLARYAIYRRPAIGSGARQDQPGCSWAKERSPDTLAGLSDVRTRPDLSRQFLRSLGVRCPSRTTSPAWFYSAMPLQGPAALTDVSSSG